MKSKANVKIKSHMGWQRISNFKFMMLSNVDFCEKIDTMFNCISLPTVFNISKQNIHYLDPNAIESWSQI